MAITINIYYSGTNGNARKFAEEMISSGIVDEIRAEKGNLKYEYFLPINDNETVLLIDSWESQHAIDTHHNSLMMQRIIDLREKVWFKYESGTIHYGWIRYPRKRQSIYKKINYYSTPKATVFAVAFIFVNGIIIL